MTPTSLLDKRQERDAFLLLRTFREGGAEALGKELELRRERTQRLMSERTKK